MQHFVPMLMITVISMTISVVLLTAFHVPCSHGSRHQPSGQHQPSLHHHPGLQHGCIHDIPGHSMEAAIFFYRGCVLKKTSFHFLPSKEVTRNCLLPDFAKEISPTEATRLYYFTFTIENSRSAIEFSNSARARPYPTRPDVIGPSRAQKL